MLYDACGECLSKARLPLESFHVTLHDLVSGAAKDCASVLAEMPALLLFRGHDALYR